MIKIRCDLPVMKINLWLQKMRGHPVGPFDGQAEPGLHRRSQVQLGNENKNSRRRLFHILYQVLFQMQQT